MNQIVKNTLALFTITAAGCRIRRNEVCESITGRENTTEGISVRI